MSAMLSGTAATPVCTFTQHPRLAGWHVQLHVCSSAVAPAVACECAEAPWRHGVAPLHPRLAALSEAFLENVTRGKAQLGLCCCCVHLVYPKQLRCLLVSCTRTQSCESECQCCVAQLGPDDTGGLLACCAQVKLPPGRTLVQPLAQLYAHGDFVPAGCTR